MASALRHAEGLKDSRQKPRAVKNYPCVENEMLLMPLAGELGVPVAEPELPVGVNVPVPEYEPAMGLFIVKMIVYTNPAPDRKSVV